MPEVSGEAMALPPGKILNEFEVLSLLGTGGMGEVYRARDTEHGREVAVKILPEEFYNEHMPMTRRTASG